MHAYKIGLNESCRRACIENQKKAVELKKIKVKQIDQYNGEIIKIFESLAEAERETNIVRAGIRMCCQGKRKTAGDFIWEYDKDDYVFSPLKYKLKPKIKVNQYTLEGEYVRTWGSITEAAKNYGVSVNRIRMCCLHIRNSKTSRNFIWRYA